MLRIRNTTGETLDLPSECRFLELTDVDGKVAKVFYQDDAGIIHVISRDDPDAKRYTGMFNVEWCELLTLPEK